METFIEKIERLGLLHVTLEDLIDEIDRLRRLVTKQELVNEGSLEDHSNNQNKMQKEKD